MLRTSSRPAQAARAAAAGLAAQPARVLLIGGTSEIGQAILAALDLGPDAEVLLAGRDAERMRTAAAGLRARVTTLSYDTTDPAAQQDLPSAAFADGPPDLVISAAGILTPQEELDADPRLAATLIDTNFTSHVTVLLAIASPAQARGPRHDRRTLVGSGRQAAQGELRLRCGEGRPRRVCAAASRTRCTGPASACCWSGQDSSPAG